MADKKLSQIDEATSAKDTDYIHVVIDDPTTPVSRRIAKRNFLKANAAVVEKTADFTVTAADKGTVFLVESANPVTITLPDSATTTLPDGYNITVKTTGNGAAVLTKAGAADGINGNATIRTGQAAGVVKHGTSPCTWEIFGNIEISAIGKTAGTLTEGNLGKFDAADNLIDAGVAADRVVRAITVATVLSDDNTLVRSDGSIGRRVQQTGIHVDDNNVMTRANMGINTQSGAYTLTPIDNNKMILLTAGGNVNITIPTGLSKGFNCSIKNTGMGTATVQSSGSDTLSGATEIKPGFTLGLVKTGATAWHTLGGDLVGTIEIGEIDPAHKSGNDLTLITGTAGDDNRLGKFNADGDLIGTGITVDNDDKITGANVSVNFQTGAAYTLDVPDNNRVIMMSANSPTTLTLPPSTDLSIGFNCVVKYTGTGSVTVSKDATHTITGETEIKPGHSLGIIKTATNAWHTFGGAIGNVAIGDIATAAKSGTGVELVTTTAATLTADNIGKFDADENLIDADIAAADIVTPSSTHIFTNKSFDANGTGNNLSNVEVADIASTSRSGSDTTLITGTKGANGNLGKFNNDGDLVDAGVIAAKAVTTDDTSAVDNTLIRQNGTSGKNIQKTGISVDDDNFVLGANVKGESVAGTTYTLAAADNNKVLVFTNAGTVVVTLPATMDDGFNCVLKYTGNDKVTVTATSPSTLTGADEIKQGHSLGIIRTAANTWHSFGGDLITPFGIADISTSARSGSDATLITGTAGADGTLSRFNADGDLVGTGVALDDNNVMTKANTGINLQSANYQLVEADNNQLIVFNSAAAMTLTLPQHTTLALPTGFNCTVKNINTGTLTLQKQGSDILNGADTVKNGQSAAIVKRGAAAPHTWEIIGGNRQRDEVFTFVMTGKISAVTYPLVLKAPFAGSITETVTRCTANTGTATFSIGTTALGGTANAVSTTRNEQAHGTANAVSVGDDINVAMTGVGSGANQLENLTITIRYKRDL